MALSIALSFRISLCISYFYLYFMHYSNHLKIFFTCSLTKIIKFYIRIKVIKIKSQLFFQPICNSSVILAVKEIKEFLNLCFYINIYIYINTQKKKYKKIKLKYHIESEF